MRCNGFNINFEHSLIALYVYFQVILCLNSTMLQFGPSQCHFIQAKLMTAHICLQIAFQVCLVEAPWPTKTKNIFLSLAGKMNCQRLMTDICIVIQIVSLAMSIRYRPINNKTTWWLGFFSQHRCRNIFMDICTYQ